jgi:hypothetical protein
MDYSKKELINLKPPSLCFKVLKDLLAPNRFDHSVELIRHRKNTHLPREYLMEYDA